MTLQAKIFVSSETTMAGEVITIPQLTEAVHAFNSSAHAGLVAFDEYPGPQNISMDRVAGSAILTIEGENVIATVNLMDNTPMGKIALQLVENDVPLYLIPVTSGYPAADGMKLRIHHLVMPSQQPQYWYENSVLRKVQKWVSGDNTDLWPMFELKEHKY